MIKVSLFLLLSVHQSDGNAAAAAAATTFNVKSDVCKYDQRADVSFKTRMDVTN